MAAQLRRSTAFGVLIVLTTINFLNYLDRYVLSAVLKDVADTLVLTDAQSGVLGSMFMVVYMVASPFSGYLGDRVRRNTIAAAGVAVWSLATMATGWAESYETMLVTRALVGIGEAGYATVAPAIIADLFEPKERGRRLSIFYLATPMGAALGYIVGGWVGQVWGWREAFYVAGAPGLVFAVVALFMPEPERGAMDDGPKPVQLPLREGLRRVFRSPTWRMNTAGTALMTFTLGGLAFWMPLFLQRERGLGSGEAATIFGGITVVAGLVGTLVGGYLGDRAQAKGQGGYFKVSGWGLLLGAPFALMMPYLPRIELLFACAFVAEFLLFLNTGPLNAALVACVPPFLRASAVAINVFFIHLLGDAFSPTLIGVVSDWQNLSLGIALTAFPVAAGGLLLMRAARAVDRMPDGLLTVDSESDTHAERRPDRDA